MAPGTDYEEQIRGINRIRNTVINATTQIICYNQTIYDDMRLEVTEYAGLTLAVRDSSVHTEVQQNLCTIKSLSRFLMMIVSYTLG